MVSKLSTIVFSGIPKCDQISLTFKVCLENICKGYHKLCALALFYEFVYEGNIVIQYLLGRVCTKKAHANNSYQG